MAIRSSAASPDGQPGLADGAPGSRSGAVRPHLLTPGTGSPMRWFFSGIWLIYLAAPIAALFGHHRGALWIAGGLAITVAFCLIYLPILMYQYKWPRQAHAGLAALALLAALACAVYGHPWTPLWIYVSAAAGMVLVAGPAGVRGAVGGVAASVVCYSFFSWLSHLDLGDYLAVLIPVLLVGLAMIGFRMQITMMHELGQARGAVAKLATNEERLRLARDMHDLTGQSLSMITLKADLAAKRLTRLPSSAERDAALAELEDIARVSRQTLHDIREAVSGYRRPTLAVEVITARHALEAAGIGLDDAPELTVRSGTFDPDAEAVLAWCLREAVTNVIRHSGARHCVIRFTEHRGELSVEVTDDGRGFGDRTDRDRQDGPDGQGQAAKGNGLRGMSERLSAAGGRLALGQAKPGGFRLTATLRPDPAVTPAPAIMTSYDL